MKNQVALQDMRTVHVVEKVLTQMVWTEVIS